MSFSFEFYARTPGQALLKMQEVHAPELVKALVNQALSQYDEAQPVVVKANGHLHNSEHGAHGHSNCEIKVAPIHFYEPPESELSETPEASYNRDLVKLK